MGLPCNDCLSCEDTIEFASARLKDNIQIESD